MSDMAKSSYAKIVTCKPRLHFVEEKNFLGLYISILVQAIQLTGRMTIKELIAPSDLSFSFSF